jgi:general secretion pathway protein A
MYSSFYGFSEKPFEVTPDPKFLYLNPGHRETLASLLYGIRERRGFIAVLGEAGTGKTTLLRSVLESLEEDVKTAYVFNTDVTFEEMLHMALADLGLAREKESVGKVEALQRLNELAIRQLSAGGNVVIMVDEAQNLDRRCMENLRLLSNLETSKHKLIQIILSGQPELEEKLRRPDLRQLSQRINLRRTILPFDEKETRDYIRHRLHVARYEGPALFTGEAETLIWEYSGGIPRKINTVCDNALLTGYGLKKRKIGGDTVREVIDDLTRNPFPELTGDRPDGAALAQPPRPPRRFGSVPFILLVACLSLLAGFGLGLLGLHLKGEDALRFRNDVRAVIPEVQAGLSDPVPLPGKPPVAERTSAPPEALAMAPPQRDLQSASASPDPAVKGVEPPVASDQPESPPLEEGPGTKGNDQGGLATHPAPVPSDPVREGTVVTAGEGDTLAKIIARNYGRYDKALERKVLEANPRIKDPDLIYVRQRITMPGIAGE